MCSVVVVDVNFEISNTSMNEVHFMAKKSLAKLIWKSLLHKE